MLLEERVEILYLVEGAQKADGLTVVIDVFRAFSLEAYLYDMGVAGIRTVGTVQEARQWKRVCPEAFLVGERRGRKCAGFDFGNSPSSIPRDVVQGKTVIHTTSSGTKGLVSAERADELLAGSLVNARATAAYILQRTPSKVSLVCMGNAQRQPAEEDILCARYIRSLLTGQELPDFSQQVAALRETAGNKFFQPERQQDYPEQDFWMCTAYDRFPFVLAAHKTEGGLRMERKWVQADGCARQEGETPWKK